MAGSSGCKEERLAIVLDGLQAGRNLMRSILQINFRLPLALLSTAAALIITSLTEQTKKLMVTSGRLQRECVKLFAFSQDKELPSKPT